MTNARDELLEHIGGKEVELVYVCYKKHLDSTSIHVKGKLEEVLPRINFEYYNGFGGQELFGYIWYTDGTWSERGEYDGSEWWEYKKVPDKSIAVEPF